MSSLFDKGLLIDLDGTLVDTIESLYHVYLEFLQARNITGTRAEFDTLNGPPLRVITAHLKQTYNFPESVETILEDYQRRIEAALVDAPLMPGADVFIPKAFGEGYRLVLVTSSPRHMAELLLTKHGLRSYFSIIVSGDDVKNGKPHPEPYLQALQMIHLPLENCLAIEDGEKGIASAKAAGLHVLTFNSWEEIGRQLPPRYEWQALDQKLSIRVIDTQPRPIEPFQEQIETIWLAEESVNPMLFNGQIFSLVNVSEQELIAELIPYKWVLAASRDHKIAQVLQLETLGVSGITRAGSNFLIAKRSSLVLHNRDCYELAPSGSLDPACIEEHGVNLSKAILAELQEECEIAPSEVTQVTPFALARDTWTHIADICVKIELSPNFNRLPASNTEYIEFQWTSTPNTFFNQSHTVVPLSRLLVKDQS